MRKRSLSGFLLRLTRGALRRVDSAIERRRTHPPLPVLSNGLEREIERFLDRIEIPEAAASYFRVHKARTVRTLALVPQGGAGSRAVELGSYLHMAAALERVLGYGEVRGAYYRAEPGVETKTLAIAGEAPFTCAIDLFDAELHRFPYEDNTLDLVLCCELIEHLLHDPMHLLCECHRVLRQGGLLVLTTPNVVSATGVACVLHGKFNPQVFSAYPRPDNEGLPHVREYAPAELRTAVEAAGFAVESLFTERIEGANECEWVLDFLEQNGFDTKLRGEQMYCLARKDAAEPRDRYPEFLYAR